MTPTSRRDARRHRRRVRPLAGRARPATLLLQLRDGARVRRPGRLRDGRRPASHELLVDAAGALAPGRRRPVRGGRATSAARLQRRPGLDRRPARRHPRVRRGGPRRLGRPRRALGATATPRRRGRRVGPARPRALIAGTDPPAARAAARRRRRTARCGSPSAAPGRRRSSTTLAERARRRAGADGLGRRQDRRGAPRRGRRLRPRRRPVRVGLRRAGRRGPRRRAARLPDRRLAAGLQPARPAAARPGGVPPGAGAIGCSAAHPTRSLRRPAYRKGAR